jgi:hypothetical protein
VAFSYEIHGLNRQLRTLLWWYEQGIIESAGSASELKQRISIISETSRSPDRHSGSTGTLNKSATLGVRNSFRNVLQAAQFKHV